MCLLPYVYKQQNSDVSFCSSSQLFLHFMHTFSCFYYNNLYNIMSVFKQLLINFCYYLSQLISQVSLRNFFFFYICYGTIISILIDIKILKIRPGKNNCSTVYWSIFKKVHLDNMNLLGYSLCLKNDTTTILKKKS